MAARKHGTGREKNRQWCISFLQAYGRRKPNGITGLVAGNHTPYFVRAPDRATALAKLRKKKDLSLLRADLGALPPEHEIPICDFDPQRRWVPKFKPTGREPDGKHYYAAIWERDPKTSNCLPTRAQALATRRELHAPLGAQYREGLRDKWGDKHDLPPEIDKRVKIGRNGCWIWTGAHGDGGYGTIAENGKQYRAHRFIFEALRDKIPEGAILRHTCNVRCCCNPGHLIPGSPLENRHDQKGRRPFAQMDYVDVPAKEAKAICLLYYAEIWTAKRIAEEFGMTAKEVRMVIKYRTGTDEKRRAWELGLLKMN